MRFLTSYFATIPYRDVLITGSQRMQERPIGILVEALRTMGAEISYQKNEGFAPILIKGKDIKSDFIVLEANVSSQYITSLMLIAPKLKNGLKIRLRGNITSMPYLKMTATLLKRLGVNCLFGKNTIEIAPKRSIDSVSLTVESDWSSASYFYSVLSMSPLGSSVFMTSFREYSLQGDSIIKDLYSDLGVDTTFQNGGILIEKNRHPSNKARHYNFVETPDIAQTFVVSCFGLGVACQIEGLHTLKIKETDRLLALENELKKLGADISVTDHSLTLNPASFQKDKLVFIDTYKDHRMAMAFSPLGIIRPIGINDPSVVSKSYPDFWEDLKTLNFEF
ncbi:3-phosphoshikimate 1-carboxyvinyltransferase [Elysia marginata]|uniref:3-phosphoshikimate 1-carboxyvinyltransferase n=1 Tax=Elysia marginata TaxID=1093978 RepID=A0AAV4FQI2_9GAST|nr:3-phosphoshikimate 1-carboxyvinyltransferase [Elysia marginata]